MWSISDLKARAWNVLKGTYWQSFLVCLLVMGIISMANYVAYSIVGAVMSGGFFVMMAGIFSAMQTGSDAAALLLILPAYLAMLVIAVVTSLARAVFLDGPLGSGSCRYFMRARDKQASIPELFFPFQNNYLNYAKVLFFQVLYVTLWSFLFVIPGIIKAYEYYMIPYILSENPNMDKQRAFELSRAMTDGEKGKIFLMDLSFLGWYLLGALTCGIGLFFVLPYVEASRAELYAAMRDKAFYLNLATKEELPGYWEEKQGF